MQFWRDEGVRSRAPAEMSPFFDAARAALDAYAGRVTPVTGELELAHGLTAVPLPGHTPGHAGVRLDGGRERLLVWGDIVHAAALQLPRPDWAVAFDVDRPLAAATRARLLDMAERDGLRVAGMHVAKVGRIERRGSGYAMV